ncbi:MAG: OmpA family protein [Alphaproteobacteria bacterium]
MSKYFADKGLMANYGRDIEPEDAARWGIDGARAQEFADARGKLMAATEANRQANPSAAAQAVVEYDRWVVLASDGWQDARITAAHDQFASDLASLEQMQQVAQAQPEGAAQAPAQPVETTSTVLYFPFDSFKMTSSATSALAELVSYIHSAGPVKVTINGHADRVGSDSYNMVLSQRRAVFVMKALQKAGVSKDEMQYFAFGETDPAVPELKNHPEPRNRRVQIFLE